MNNNLNKDSIFQLKDIKFYDENSWDYSVVKAKVFEDWFSIPSIIYLEHEEMIVAISNVYVITDENKNIIEEKVNDILKDDYLTKKNIIWIVTSWKVMFLLECNWVKVDWILDNIPETMKKNFIHHLGWIFYTSLLYTWVYENLHWKAQAEMLNSDRIEEVIEKITEEILPQIDEDKSIIEQAEELVHVLNKYAEYDERFEISNQEKFEEQAQKYPEVFNIYTPILDKVWVCESFSWIYALILSMIWGIASVEYHINTPSVNHFNCLVESEWRYFIADPTMNYFKEITKEEVKNKKSITM